MIGTSPELLVNTVVNLPELQLRVNEYCLTKMAAPAKVPVRVTVMKNCRLHQHGISRVEHLSKTSWKSDILPEVDHIERFTCVENQYFIHTELSGWVSLASSFWITFLSEWQDVCNLRDTNQNTYKLINVPICNLRTEQLTRFFTNYFRGIHL